MSNELIEKIIEKLKVIPPIKMIPEEIELFTVLGKASKSSSMLVADILWDVCISNEVNNLISDKAIAKFGDALYKMEYIKAKKYFFNILNILKEDPISPASINALKIFMSILK